MTPAELDEIRERAEKATEGPWKYEEESYKDEENRWQSATTVEDGRGDEVLHDDGYLDDDDAQFIAAARTDIPKLLSHISKQDEELKRLREVEQAARRMMKHITVIEKSSD